MANRKRTIMGSIDYSLATLQNLKKGLLEVGAVNSELNWAIGGIVAILISNLLMTCDQVFQKSSAESTPDAKQDLNEIKDRFGIFIERMVNHE